MSKINAIVLAAGFGTRLRPLTDLMPKPLVPVANIPLLENVLINLTKAGIDKVAVNTHHLAEQLDDFIAQSVYHDRVELFNEPEILGTGGPLVNAREVLSETPFFLLHNSDILTDMDLRQLCETHRENGNKVTMALIDGPENKVRLSADGRIHDILDKLDRCPPKSFKLTYSGVMVLSTEIFNWLPDTPCNCSVIRAILDLMTAEPDAVGAFLPQNAYWNDLGTLPKYFQVHQDIIEHKINLEHFNFTDNCICEPGAVIPSDCKLDGFIVAGADSVIGSGAKVCNCILLEGAVVKPGQMNCNQVITRTGTIHRDFNELSKLAILKPELNYDIEICSLPEAGSVRRFYRIDTLKKSLVLVLSDESDADFDRFVDYGRFLSGSAFPTPDVYAACGDEFSVLVEDLGNDTLFDRVKSADSTAEIKTLYQSVIDSLVEFQQCGTEVFKHSDAPLIRRFVYDYLRWETDYFSNKFLDRYLAVNISSAEHDTMNEAFNRLGRLVDEQPKYLLHRDFQSQNIMVTDTDIILKEEQRRWDCNSLDSKQNIRFVDYQGMRLGPPGYDIVSLLNDPYVELDVELRNELFEYYIAQAGKYIPGDLESYILSAWLQRSMQALGAYSFLALEKHKSQYLQYIPRGVELLIEGLDRFEKKFSFTIPGLRTMLMTALN
jgi:NDP-sugar pyrophosphorylase family protein/aminoglycoside/choline kinase family phosphotransferase